MRNLVFAIRRIRSNRLSLFASLYLIFLIFLGIFGERLAPYDYQENHRGSDGSVLRAEGPSFAHPLGTTEQGHDVLSRVIIGAEPTMYTALLGGLIIISIGLTIGVTAGYVGGVVDDMLMRFTDMAYSVPLIPFAIVMIAFLDIGFFSGIVIIGVILWRTSARVLRSQVLQIRERSYVTSAKTIGASRRRIIVKHILPNVAPMAALFLAMGMGLAVIVQAGLAFIGVADPFVPSWGIMIRNAYNSGYMTVQWLWALVPGFMISLTVMSAFILGREFEEKEGSSAIQETRASIGGDE